MFSPKLGALVVICAATVTATQQPLFSSAFGIPGINTTYDYVVVGGGTAGLTIAARLAQWHSVAVIEAGGFYEVENGNNSVVPLLSLTGIAFIDTSPTFTPQPLMDWGLVTEPIAGAASRRVHYTQGKTLGGSSAINTMSYVRGTRGAYGRWASVVGDSSYEWDAMLAYSKKSCRLTPPDLAARNATNATVFWDAGAFDPKGGPLDVSWNKYVDPTLTWLAKAVQEVGLPLSPIGFESGILAGKSAWVPGTISPDKAERSSSESSFLREAIHSTRLTVYTHALATKILFETSSDTPRAVGVQIDTGGIAYTISARNEVIVTAGTFHSPQLLLVSGIGSRAILDSLSVPVVADIPGVGQNVWDPIQIFGSYPLSTPSAQTQTLNPALVPGYLEEYLSSGSGPFSSAAGFLAAELLPAAVLANLSSATRAKLAEYPDDWPHLTFIVGSFPGPNLTTIGTIAAYAPIVFSRGNITIRSADIRDPPIINLNWMADPADAELAVAGVKRLRAIWATDAANAVKSGPELFPGANVQSDAQILEYVRSNANPIWHGSSSCAMGKAEDVSKGKAVVDSKGRVFGVRGLRIADASAFPFGVPGHPQAAVYALAEKIADAIKQDNL